MRPPSVSYYSNFRIEIQHRHVSLPETAETSQLPSLSSLHHESNRNSSFILSKFCDQKTLYRCNFFQNAVNMQVHLYNMARNVKGVTPSRTSDTETTKSCEILNLNHFTEAKNASPSISYYTNSRIEIQHGHQKLSLRSVSILR